MNTPAPTTTFVPRLRRLAAALAAITMLAAAASAEAANVSLDPAATSASNGSQVSFDLLADFGSTVMLGGAVDVAWDALVLHFAGFAFDAGLAPPRRDTAFDVVDLQSSELLSVGLASFGGITLPAGTKLGTLTFDVVGGDGASTNLTLDASAKWSGYFAVNGDPFAASFAGAQFSVTPSTVPLPGSQWLMLGALAGLATRMRRRATA